MDGIEPAYIHFHVQVVKQERRLNDHRQGQAIKLSGYQMLEFSNRAYIIPCGGIENTTAAQYLPFVHLM